MMAEDVMSSPVLSLNVDTTLKEAASILSEHRISGALVTDRRGDPVGVVSLFDIVSYMAGFERPAEEPGGFYRYSYPKFSEGGEGWDGEWDVVEEESLKEITVGEIMSPEIITVSPKLPLADVGKLLAERHIHRTFVAGPDGPVGVISTMDVLGGLTGVKRPRAGGIHASPA